jgi:hypothetical protein
LEEVRKKATQVIAHFLRLTHGVEYVLTLLRICIKYPSFEKELDMDTLKLKDLDQKVDSEGKVEGEE